MTGEPITNQCEIIEPAGRTIDDPPNASILLARARQSLQSGKRDQAETAFRQYLAVVPRDFEALYTVGLLAAGRDDLAEAVRLIRDALSARPDNIGARTNLAAIFSRLGDEAGAVEQLREILKYDPYHACRVDVTHWLVRNGEPAKLADFASGLRAEDLGTFAFLACMPKSGSTFLKRALCALSGWKEAQFAYSYFQNEQDIYLPNVLAEARSNVVVQQHCRATEANVHILHTFGVRPLVLVRNLFDIVVSLADFYDAGGTINTFFAGYWETFERERRLDLIIDNVVPWYLSFFVSWTETANRGRLPCMLIRYEDVIARKPETLRQIGQFVGLDKSLDECHAAVAEAEAANTRLNKGVAGRGEAELSDDQKSRIKALASYYPGVDFSPIGL